VDAGLAPTRLPEGLRLRRRGRLQFAFHSGPGRVTVPAPAGATWVLGSRDMGPADVAAWIAD
jgi:beta-galactosidase